MNLGTRLKKLRLERGMSQRELATLVGCSHQTIADCEKNRNDGRIQILKNSVSYLMFPQITLSMGFHLIIQKKYH